MHFAKFNSVYIAFSDLREVVYLLLHIKINLQEIIAKPD